MVAANNSSFARLALFVALATLGRTQPGEGDIDYDGFRVGDDNLHECLRVEQLPDSAEDFFASFQLARQPIVFTPGAVAGDDAREKLDELLNWRTQRWSAEYMAKKAGDLTVFVEQVNKTADQSKSTSTKTNFGWGKGSAVTFGHFLQQWWEADDEEKVSYMNIQHPEGADQSVNGPLSRLSADFSAPGWFLATRMFMINMWIGLSPSYGQRSNLHHDYHDNLYVVLQGRKEFTFYDPSEIQHLYPNFGRWRVNSNGLIDYLQEGRPNRPHFSLLPTGTWDELSKKQKKKWPLFKKARPMRCNVSAGEMLYLPGSWWHEVVSYGKHLTVNFWVEPPANEAVIRYHDAIEDAEGGRSNEPQQEL